MPTVNVTGKGLLVLALGLLLCGCPGWNNHRRQGCCPSDCGGPVRPAPTPPAPPPTPPQPPPAPPPAPSSQPAPNDPAVRPSQLPGTPAVTEPAKVDSGRPPAPQTVQPRPEVKPDATALADASPVKTTAPPTPPDPVPAPTPPPPPVDAAKPRATVSLPDAPPPAGLAAVAPPSPTSADAPAGDSAAELRRLAQQAQDAADRLDACTARLTRREQVMGKAGPEELMECKFRKEPFSVAFKWVGKASKGREVIYVQGQYENKINTWLSPEDRYFGLHRTALAPDSPLVRSRSRYPITTAGLWWPVGQFRQLVAALDKGDKRYGTLSYVGPRTRPEYPRPMELVEHTVPPGAEAVLPGGGKRQWFFDPDGHLPLLIITADEHGQEVEYYCYTDVQPATNLTDADFNPEKQWAGRR